MRELLRRIFVEDWTLKLVAFALAVLLFFVRSDWEASAPAYVRLHYIYPEDRVVTSELPGEVKIVVRGPWSRANRFSEAELDPITIDLTRRDEGDLRFVEDMVRLPRGLRVGSFTPPSIHLSFEPKVERMLPVQPVIEGEPAEGYRLGRVTAEPRTVRVVGARSVVESMRNAQTRPVRVTDLRSPLEARVKLAPAPRFARIVDTLDVLVRVEVERTLVERTYSNVQVTVTGSSRTGDIQVVPPVVEVVLRGPQLALERLQGTPEVAVDASPEEHKPAGTYRKRLQVVNLPPDVAAELRPDWVHLTIGRPPGK
ncbi:MAG: CdaR family protein [Myxococcales bacterium]|nr:CdaR family protein [Myxococcota bacterium]MDW8283022.1 CdaR family protein [Myxococcales bacterium]